MNTEAYAQGQRAALMKFAYAGSRDYNPRPAPKALVGGTADAQAAADAVTARTNATYGERTAPAAAPAAPAPAAGPGAMATLKQWGQQGAGMAQKAWARPGGRLGIVGGGALLAGGLAGHLMTGNGDNRR